MFHASSECGQNRNIKVVSESFGNVFMYLGATITNQNCNIPEEFKRRLSLLNAYYQLRQNLYIFPSKDIKMKIIKTVRLNKI
jgi:hypothetical protein